jgi:hypothetical protein
MHRQAVRHERPSVHASPDVKAWAATQAFRLFVVLRFASASHYGSGRYLGQFPPGGRVDQWVSGDLGGSGSRLGRWPHQGGSWNGDR